MQNCRGRYLRFSLASVLLVVTVVAICLAPIVNRVHHQSRTIETIERIGGTVQYGPERARSSRLRSLLDDDYFRTPSLIDLQSCPATDALVEDISHLPGVLQLNVCETKITDEALRHVARMRQLKALDIGFNNITNDGLVHLAPLDELLYLGLDVTEVNDDGLESLRELPQLHQVHLYGNNITDRGAAKLATITWICEFDLANTLITNDGLAHLAKLPHLTSMRLDQMSLGSGEQLRIDDGCVPHLIAMPELLYVSLSNLTITDEGLARLKAQKPALIVRQ